MPADSSAAAESDALPEAPRRAGSWRRLPCAAGLRGSRSSCCEPRTTRTAGLNGFSEWIFAAKKTNISTLKNAFCNEKNVSFQGVLIRRVREEKIAIKNKSKEKLHVRNEKHVFSAECCYILLKRYTSSFSASHRSNVFCRVGPPVCRALQVCGLL